MNDVNYVLFDLIRFNQFVSESLEYSSLNYKYNKEELDNTFKDNYLSYEKGFLFKFLLSTFHKSQKITSPLKKYFSYYVKKEKFVKMIDSDSIRKKIGYVDTLVESHDLISSIIDMVISQNDNDIDSSIKELEKNSYNLYLSSLLFYLAGFVSTSLGDDKNNRIRLKKKEIKDILKFIIYVYDELDEEDILKKSTEEFFNLFNDRNVELNKLEDSLLNLYTLTSNKSIALEKNINSQFIEISKKLIEGMQNNK